MSDIAIYEILYDKNHGLSDSNFVEYKVDNYQPEWRVFRLLIDFYRAGGHSKHVFAGLFSPKFCLKTKIETKFTLLFHYSLERFKN